MHSRIFKILSEEELKELHNGNIRVPFSMLEAYEDQLPYFADYVAESDLDDDFQWLIERCESTFFDYNREEKSIVFKQGFKEEYFGRQWNNILKKINDGDPKQNFAKFCNDTDNFVYELKSDVEERYGFYQADLYNCYQPFDAFIRGIIVGNKYYLVDSVDYHCYK